MLEVVGMKIALEFEQRTGQWGPVALHKIGEHHFKIFRKRLIFEKIPEGSKILNFFDTDQIELIFILNDLNIEIIWKFRCNSPSKNLFKVHQKNTDSLVLC